MYFIQNDRADAAVPPHTRARDSLADFNLFFVGHMFMLSKNSMDDGDGLASYGSESRTRTCVCENQNLVLYHLSYLGISIDTLRADQSPESRFGAQSP